MNRKLIKVAIITLGALIMVGCGYPTPSNATARDAMIYLASAAQAENGKAFIMAFSPELRNQIKSQKSWESGIRSTFFGKMADLKISQRKVDDDTVKILASWRTGNTMYSFPSTVFIVKKIEGSWLITNIDKAGPMEYSMVDENQEQINITPLK